MQRYPVLLWGSRIKVIKHKRSKDLVGFDQKIIPGMPSSQNHLIVRVTRTVRRQQNISFGVEP
jgi:hypothetical protein